MRDRIVARVHHRKTTDSSVVPTPAEPVTDAAPPVARVGGHDFSAISIAQLWSELPISEPGDPLEQEADRIADEVLGMSESATHMRSRREPQPLQALRVKAGGGDGNALDASTLALMTPRFGFDFSSVRIHADEQAAHAARSVNAKAY